MSFVIAPIVEGHGDVVALPILLRRLDPSLQIRTPVRFPKTKLLIGEHLLRAAQIASSNIVGRGAVLVVIDADEGCAATLAGGMEKQLREALPILCCRVAIAVREFEAWIVGGHREFQCPDPDNAAGLKHRIRERFGIYKETVDQPRLVAGLDLELLSGRSRSFRHLRKIIEELIPQE